MVLFAQVPSEFPFEADLSERPATYHLQADSVSRIPRRLLCVFWIVAGPFVIVLFAGAFAGPDGVSGLMTWLEGGLIVAYLYWAVFHYFGPEFLETFRIVDVTIGASQVDVVDRKLFLVKRWSEPLDGFTGVALVNLGMHEINDNQVSVAGVFLRHPADGRSVPLVVRPLKQLGRKTVEKYAGLLGLAPIKDISDVDAAQSYPDQVIVSNRRQALKVRIVYWAGMAGALACLAATAMLAAGDPAQPLPYALAFLCLAVMAGLQVYASCYVVELSESGGTVSIRTASPIRPLRRVSVSKVRSMKANRGRLWTYRQSVNAPWISLKVEGHILPFIIDMQSDYVADKRFDRLLG